MCTSTTSRCTRQQPNENTVWVQTNKGTIDAIFVTRRLQGYAERSGNNGLMLLLDWEKAFDKITHKWLFKALEAMCTPDEILSLIEELHKTNTSTWK